MPKGSKGKARVKRVTFAEPGPSVPGPPGATVGRQRFETADALLADLRAAVNPQAGSGMLWHGDLTDVDETTAERVEHLLGPDSYNVRAPKPAREFLHNVNLSAIAPAQWAAFFHRVSMTRPVRPTREELDPANLPATGGVARATRPEHLRSWGPNRELLPLTTETEHSTTLGTIRSKRSWQVAGSNTPRPTTTGSLRAWE